MIPGPISSTTIAATATVFSRPGQLFGAVLTAGADAASVILRDNTAGSGNVVLTLKAAINATTSVIIPNGIALGVGCHATITGTTPSLTVYGG